MQQAAATAEPKAGIGFELGEILRILSDQRKVILACGALGLVLGIVSALVMTPLFRASAMLEFNPTANDMLESASRPGQYTMSRGNNQELLQTQIGLLRSEALARRVVEDLNLAANEKYGGAEGTREQKTNAAVAVVRGGTSVDAVKGSMLIQVSHVSVDRELAAKVAQGLADGFIASNLERRYDFRIMPGSSSQNSFSGPRSRLRIPSASSIAIRLTLAYSGVRNRKAAARGRRAPRWRRPISWR